MVCVLIRHKVADYPKWRSVFDSSIAFRQAGGETNCRIFRTPDNGDELTLFFEWETMGKARQFMNSPELRSRMQQAGVVGQPEIHFLGELYMVRRSAAD